MPFKIDRAMNVPGAFKLRPKQLSNSNSNKGPAAMNFVSRTTDGSLNRIRGNFETEAGLLRIQLRKTVAIVMAKMLVLVMPLLMPASTAAQEESVTSKWLQESMDRLREESHLVGVGTTLLIDGKIVAAAVSGKRRQNSDVAVTVDDKWHIGSITKSMTATVVGRLVERGQVSWDSSLPDLLPEMELNFDQSWDNVTLHNVLTHTAGLPANFSLLQRLAWPDNRDEVHIRRREALSEILAQPAASSPGTAFVYSNIGYTLAGFIAAEKAGTTWEALMEDELFKPLRLQSAGFGPPQGDQPLDQPWGHQRALFMRSPMDPRKRADNSPVMGPAGIVHISMADLARFGWEHLQGEAGNSDLLQQETFRKLHDPVMNHYACGWVNMERDWSDGRFLWHNGSNTMWYSLLVLIPSKHAVVVFVTNDGDITGAETQFFKLAESVSSKLPARKW